MTESTSSITRRQTDKPLGGLVSGAVLLLLGGLLLASKLDLGINFPGGLRHYWPFLIILVGLVKIALPDRDGREGGFWILLSGVYCLISVFGLFGLGWGSAWPLFMIGAGAMMAVQALLGRRSCSSAVTEEEVRRGDA